LPAGAGLVLPLLAEAALVLLAGAALAAGAFDTGAFAGAAVFAGAAAFGGAGSTGAAGGAACRGAVFTWPLPPGWDCAAGRAAGVATVLADAVGATATLSPTPAAFWVGL
jgi:hypothetical protein